MASQKLWFVSYVIVNHRQSPISLCTLTLLLTGNYVLIIVHAGHLHTRINYDHVTMLTHTVHYIRSIDAQVHTAVHWTIAIMHFNFASVVVSTYYDWGNSFIPELVHTAHTSEPFTTI